MLRAVAAAALFSAAGAVQACGYCVEDKIAGVYDHAVVTQAIGRKHGVVFFAIDGKLKPGDATRRRIEVLAASAPGVDRGSVRLSMEAAMLAVAFDPRHVPLAQLHGILERRLAGHGLSLMALRVLQDPGDPAAVRRR